MMTRELFEAIIGEKFSDEPVSETLREIERLRAIGRALLDVIRLRTRSDFPGSGKSRMEERPWHSF